MQLLFVELGNGWERSKEGLGNGLFAVWERFSAHGNGFYRWLPFDRQILGTVNSVLGTI
jgi:hypothetical protein